MKRQEMLNQEQELALEPTEITDNVPVISGMGEVWPGETVRRLFLDSFRDAEPEFEGEEDFGNSQASGSDILLDRVPFSLVTVGDTGESSCLAEYDTDWPRPG